MLSAQLACLDKDIHPKWCIPPMHFHVQPYSNPGYRHGSVTKAPNSVVQLQHLAEILGLPLSAHMCAQHSILSSEKRSIQLRKGLH